MRRPSKAIAHTGSASEAAPGRRAGLYHSTMELTKPNSSRAVVIASASGRMSPSCDGLGDELGYEPVEGTPLVERGPLDVGVAAHPEQQGDVG